MTCLNCCQYFHKTTAMTVTDDILVVTATNTTTLPAEQSPFCLVVCQNANTVSTTEIPINITIAGTNYPVYNKYGKAMQSTELANYTRKRICGYFVVNGASTYVIFNEVPRMCACGGS